MRITLSLAPTLLAFMFGITPLHTAVAETATLAPVLGAPPFGSLIKPVCPVLAGTTNPCKAIYFYGTDGKRHAFPNERVYSTWQTGFAGVVTVTDSVIFSIPLGKNIVYRPGIRLVKFTTLPRVYAVGRSGELRWVASENIARELYGSDWNLRIDDISDTFFADYHFGSDINSTSEFDPKSEAMLVSDVNLNL